MNAKLFNLEEHRAFTRSLQIMNGIYDLIVTKEFIVEREKQRVSKKAFYHRVDMKSDNGCFIRISFGRKAG